MGEKVVGAAEMGCRMPLSEDEERILQDIERTFYEQDPKFAKAVDRDPAQKRTLKLATPIAVALFIVGLAIIVLSFTRQPLVAFIGFVAMSAGAGMVVQNRFSNTN